MSGRQEVRVPHLGDVDEVEVVEILVAVGEEVAAEAGLLVLGSDKATMDLPAPAAGKVAALEVEAGAKVAVGDLVAILEVSEASEGDAEAAPAPPAEKTEKADPGPKSDANDATEPEAAPEREPESQSEPTPAAPAASDGSDGGEAQSASGASRVVVIGAGPGGYSAAFRAADLGLDVTLVERYPTLGGVCLNVGCIPSKALLHAAEVIEQAALFADHGVRFGEPKIELPKLRDWKASVVGRLTDGLVALAARRKVRVVHGTARFVSDRKLSVAGPEGTTEIDFDQAIVAVGSRPVELPFLPDDPRVMDSTGALELAQIPQRLLVIGGGIIGLEMATVYDALGSRVSVVELADGLVPGCDRDLVRPLAKRIGERYEAILLSTSVAKVESEDRGLRAYFDGKNAPDPRLYDGILSAVGRRPNGAGLGLENAGVTVTGQGFVPADREQRTNVPHIFSVGDVAGGPMLAHKAVHEAKVAAEVAAGEKSSFDARVVPSVAYTDPEIAWVGLTETEAKAQGIAYEKTSIPWGASGRALSLGRSEGKTKMLFDPETERILGAGAVGVHAGDLISEAALAIEMHADARDLALTIHPHPTLSETLAFAAEAFDGSLTDLYLPRKRRKKG